MTCMQVKPLPRKALVTAPCYAGYARALEASGAEVTEYMLTIGEYGENQAFVKIK